MPTQWSRCARTDGLTVPLDLASVPSCADCVGHAPHHLCSRPGDEGGVGEEPLGVVLAMTTIMYACCAAARTTQSAETNFSWVAFVVFAGIVVFWGSVGWHAVKE